MSSVEQDCNGDELDCGEEVLSGLVVAGGDSSELFEFVEEPFDEVALLVECKIARSRVFAIALRWNHRGDLFALQEFNKAIGVERLVGDQRVGIGVFDETRRGLQFMDLPLGQREGHRIAQGIDESVNLGRQPAARAPDRLIFAPFLRAPALC